MKSEQVFEQLQQFKKMLFNLKGFLTKAQSFAEVKKFDSSNFLTARLSPDQFAFARQVQISCDAAKLTFSRVSGKPAPVHEDKETTLLELQNRVQSVMDYLAGFSEKDFEKYEERLITTPWWNGKSMKADKYLVQYAIPNFHFHVVTAYSILRKNGVDLGKADYLGELPFL